MKRLLIFLLVLPVAFLAAEGQSDTNSKEKSEIAGVSIQMLNSKGEIQSSLEEMAALFNDETGANLEILGLGAGQSPFEKILSLYASGNAPALYMGDAMDLIKLQDKFMDLSGEKWIADASEGMLTAVTEGDTVLGFPLTVEGFGFIYNKSVIEAAGVDTSSINTIDALEEAFEKVEASGKGALVISPMDWSLAAHYLGIGYETGDADGYAALFEDLKSGAVSTADNKGTKGIINTFDVMIKHNVGAGDPLAVTYEKGPELLGMDEIGFWFMGNWAWPQIESFAEPGAEFGFIPVPISNDPADYGNTQISVSPSKFVALDMTQNDAAQQKAAQEFLNWMVYDEDGQDALVNGCNVIPAFNNVTLQPMDPLGKDIKKYLGEGNTIPFVNSPPDHWSVVGAFMQKYLAGKMTKAELFSSIDNYWVNLE